MKMKGGAPMSARPLLTPTDLFEPHEGEVEMKFEIARFCADKLQPLATRAIRIEHLDEGIYDESVQIFIEFGAHRWAIPEALGGDGPISGRLYAWFTRMSAAIPGAADLALNIGVTISLGSKPLTTYGLTQVHDEEVFLRVVRDLLNGAIVCYAQTEPDVGSDVTAIGMKVEHVDGVWKLTGTKRFIGGGWKADYALVAARTEGDAGDQAGISVFLVDCNEARANGTLDSSSNEIKLGLPHSPTTEMVFTNAAALGVVGPLHDGYRRVLLPTLVDSRATETTAQAVGLMDAAITEAVTFAEKRKQFGEPIVKLDKILDMLLQMRANRQMAWLLNLQSATLRDACNEITPGDSRPYAMVAALAKLFGGEVVRQVAITGLQTHGGAGYIQESPITRVLRDAFIVGIYNGTSQIQGLIILENLRRMHTRGELAPEAWPFVTIPDDALSGWHEAAKEAGVLKRRQTLQTIYIQLAETHLRTDQNQHPLLHDWVWALANHWAAELVLWQQVYADAQRWDDARRKAEGVEEDVVHRAQRIAQTALDDLKNGLLEANII